MRSFIFLPSSHGAAQIDLAMVLMMMMMMIMMIVMVVVISGGGGGGNDDDPDSILNKSTAGRYPDGPITARYRFM